MKTKYKFINFEQHENSLWSIKNNKSKDILGYVEYYPQWKEYVFVNYPLKEMVFSVKCLLDIIDFIKNLANDKEKT